MKSEKIFKAYFELGQFGLPINEVEYIIKVLKSFSYLSKRDGLGLPHINIENDTEPTGKVTSDVDEFEIYKGAIRFMISLACLKDGGKLADELYKIAKTFNCIVRQTLTIHYWQAE
ncbi:hypothetical protein IJI17_01050 [Candidatus Saccharibacteria bacterium]|nr:hypothetical protein [Candidatus Saccharibacteria bacterium]